MDPFSLIALGATALALLSCRQERTRQTETRRRRDEFGADSVYKDIAQANFALASMAVDKIAKFATPRAMARLEQVDDEVNSAIRSTVKTAPFRMFDIVSSAMVDGAGTLDRLAGKLPSIRVSKIQRIRGSVGHESNIAEVQEGFAALRQYLAQDKELAALTNSVAQQLEADKIFGLGATRNAVRVLAVLAGTGMVARKFMAGKPLAVSTPHGDISLTKNLDYKAALRFSAPERTRAALKIALSGARLGRPTGGDAAVTLPFIRQGTTTLGVQGVSAAGVKGFSAGVGFQTIPERGAFQVGVKGTPRHPVQSGTFAAPTQIYRTRRGRTASFTPSAAIDPRRGGERSVGVQLKMPI